MPLPAADLLVNTSDTTGGGDVSNTLPVGLASEFTILVTTTGSPTSLSIDIEGWLGSREAEVIWYRLFNITQPGFYTISTHWVAAIRANLITLSGGSSPTVSVMAVSPDPYQIRN